MSKKSLVIIGSYPNSETIRSVLKDSILSLRDDFDVALSTHYPADLEIQNLVNYYIYDYRNEMIVTDNPYFWAHFPPVYFEIYGNEKKNTDHGFAVFRAIMNAVSLTKDYYDNFFYIEGDCIFSKNDVELLKETTEKSKKSGKNGWVFKYDNFISTVMFNMDMEFFVKNIPFPKNTEEYQQMVTDYQSYGILENLLYCILRKNEKIDDLLLLENILQNDYFTSSKLQLNSVYTQSITNEPISFHFRFHIVKVYGQDNIAFVYLNNNDIEDGYIIHISVDDTLLKEIDTSKRSMVAEKIFPVNDLFVVGINKHKFTFSKTEILKDKSFVKFD